MTYEAKLAPSPTTLPPGEVAPPTYAGRLPAGVLIHREHANSEIMGALLIGSVSPRRLP